MNLAPKHEANLPSPSPQEVDTRCERCGHGMAVRAITATEIVVVAGPATQNPDQVTGATREPTAREIFKFFWDPKQRPTWRDYMIAGDQTIRLI